MINHPLYLALLYLLVRLPSLSGDDIAVTQENLSDRIGLAVDISFVGKEIVDGKAVINLKISRLNEKIDQLKVYDLFTSHIRLYSNGNRIGLKDGVAVGDPKASKIKIDEANKEVVLSVDIGKYYEIEKGKEYEIRVYYDVRLMGIKQETPWIPWTKEVILIRAK